MLLVKCPFQTLVPYYFFDYLKTFFLVVVNSSLAAPLLCTSAQFSFSFCTTSGIVL